MLWSDNTRNIEFISYAIKMWSNDNNQRNSTTKSWQWFAIERKFFLNHSVPSICDILCPKRKIGFPYVFEWVACKWLNEKNRWVCTDFCYISGNLKYRNVSFHLKEIVYIYNANIDIDKCKTFAKLIDIFCDCGTTLYLFSLFLLNLNQSRRSKKLENHIKLTLIFPFFLSCVTNTVLG